MVYNEFIYDIRRSVCVLKNA